MRRLWIFVVTLLAGSQAERYAARCSVPVDRAAYEQGYGEGFAQRPPPTGL